MAENDAVTSTEPPPPPPRVVVGELGRPTITLPPRGGTDSLFSGSGFGLSPGPMTLVSSFFAENDPDSDCRSFSQLLAGAMTSPRPHFSGEPDLLRFRENRPAGLAVSQPQGIFTIPPGLSPAGLLDSPGLFPAQGAFGMSHQQALAQVTAQANLHMQDNFPSSLGIGLPGSAPYPPSTSESIHQNVSRPMPHSAEATEPTQFSSVNQRSLPASIIVDKPADDGYNWRKYGQKQVKGSEFPRSYYKCTHSGCPVKKKVERSLDGQVTEIIYKGQHNHPPPQRRSKDGANPNGNFGSHGNLESSMTEGMGYSLSRRDQESSQATAEHMSSDDEEVGNDETRESEDEPDAKRRNTEIRVSEQAASHRMVTEPKIIVQTTSEVDLLDDGYRWRKYGQKVVKGNPHPRSYYKCTYTGCNVRKHIERAASDPKAVITTYEGKHNHDVPAARTSSHNMANTSSTQLRPPTLAASNNPYVGKSDCTSSQQPVALLQLKEERIT